MKKMILAGLVTALLLTGCGATPDAVVDQMKQVDITVCNNESDMLQVKDKIGEAAGEKWKVNPEHQKTLINIQNMLKKIWKKEWDGYRLLTDGDTREGMEISLKQWSTVKEYDPGKEDTGSIADNIRYSVLSDTRDRRTQLLEKLEKIGFTGLAAQVESYKEKADAEPAFYNHGIIFSLSRAKKEHSFYNVLEIAISQGYVMMPDSLKAFVPEELLSGYQIHKMTTEGKVKTLQFSSFDTTDDNYRHGIYYVMDEKLLQAEFYVSVSKYDRTTGYVKNDHDYKIFDMPANEKAAIARTFMMLGASKEQADAAIKELETQKSYKGTAGDVHWYYDRTEKDSLNEEWRLRIQ